MDYIQFPMSEELKNYSKEKQRVREKGLPFESLYPGFSFAIPIAKCNMTSLQVQCSKQSKKLGRVFKIYYHAAAGIVEVGRLDGMDKLDAHITSVIDDI